jgi:dTDP-L-rhamnose 4-epimerase
MPARVLITGGAGFLGTHLADELLAHGYVVRALDVLAPPVHGSARRRPACLDPRVELVVGDVRQPDVVRRALAGCDLVVHLAAAVGAEQSMYQVAEYTGVNALGTAVLLEGLLERPVARLVVGSSRSVYGEGRYITDDERVHDDVVRDPAGLAGRRWDPVTRDGRRLYPVPTPETKPPSVGSVYALSKFDQERLCLLVGRAYRIPTVALRLFDVYGPRRSLGGACADVTTTFALRLLGGRPPLVFEDGLQQRDFVEVRDAARAFRLALEAPGAAGEVINIGSGQGCSVAELARRLARVADRELAPAIIGEYRPGDVRHCTADIARAQRMLGFEPAISHAEGLAEVVAWLRRPVAAERRPGVREERRSTGAAR